MKQQTRDKFLNMFIDNFNKKSIKFYHNNSLKKININIKMTK